MLKQIYFFCICFLFTCSTLCSAQIKRERVVTKTVAKDIFWSNNLVTQSTVRNLEKGNLNVNIKHAFGFIDEGADDLFGLDEQVNVRLGVDYGITDWLSVGFGRQSEAKVLDLRTKINIIQQMSDNSIPLFIAVKGSVARTTEENNLNFEDDLSYFASVMFARKFGDKISLQVAPMISHFNTVVRERQGDELLDAQNNHYAIGLGFQYKINQTFAVNIDYLPVIGERTDNTNNAFSIGLDVETGGHVFQMFFSSTRWHTEDYALARNESRFFKNDIRFGFNINRLFWLGSR